MCVYPEPVAKGGTSSALAKPKIPEGLKMSYVQSVKHMNSYNFGTETPS